MPVHHIALRSADPARLAAFYKRVLRLPELQQSFDAAGLYSVWLDLDGTILMIERGASRQTDAGWDGVFIRVEPGAGPVWTALWAKRGVEVEARTGSTLYARDPDGNRFGVSCWPGGLDP